MATSIPTSPKRGPRVRESAREGEIGRDAQYDLLTAALIGAAIGATATLLLRRGPSGQRPVTPVMRGAKWAGRGAAAAGMAGAKWAREHGSDLIDRIPMDRIEHDVRESVGEARDRVDAFVQHELRDLRKALRRQRRRLGI
jgi:gas vesicle protein